MIETARLRRLGTSADAVPAVDGDGAADASQDMVQCEFCGGWYEEGNVFRSHICSERGEAYALQE